MSIMRDQLIDMISIFLLLLSFIYLELVERECHLKHQDTVITSLPVHMYGQSTRTHAHTHTHMDTLIC